MENPFKVKTEKFPFDHVLKVTLYGEEISIAGLVNVANTMANKLAEHGEKLQIVKNQEENKLYSSGVTLR